MTTTTHSHFSPHRHTKPPPGASQTRTTKTNRKGNQDRRQSSAHQIPIGAWRPAGILLEATEIRIWQHAACPVAGRLAAVTQCPERDILLGAVTKVAGPQGLPISMLVCVFNTGLNGKDKSQHPGLFLSREVLLFQLLMPDCLMHIYAYMHIYERNVCFHRYAD